MGDARGGALLSALIMISLLSALAIAYSMNVRSAILMRGGVTQQKVGYYAAEAGLNVGITRFANKFKANGFPEETDFEHQIRIGNRTVDITLAEVPDCAPCEPREIFQGELFAGLKTVPYGYTVQSRSYLRPEDTEAHLAGEFDIHNIPIFQFLAFIDGHLFVAPQPYMSLHGRLHTNSNLYFSPHTTLRVEDLPPTIPNVQVSAVDDIYRGARKYDSGWDCLGHAYIDKREDVVSPLNDLDPKEMSCAGSSPVADATLAGWKGSIARVKSSIITPDVGIINRGTGEYWKRADLRIVLRLDAARASIDFSAADLCPGGWGTMQSPPLFPIEVQGAGAEAKTRALQRFMCERRGALFYTDLPNNPPNVGSTSYPETAVKDPSRYTPAFGHSARVYRRVGEDTSGNGTLSTTDRNDAICPAGGSNGEAAAWWKPPSCAWPKTSLPTDSWFHDMDYRRGGFFNHREQQWMYLLNLNVRALIEWNAANGDPLFAHDDDTEGGLLIFLSVQGPNSSARSNNYGVRIFDSADLDMRNVTFPPGVADPTGLTIVSDQAIIVEGNYNTRDKYPAAIMGDAIWVLSQGWETPRSTDIPNDLKSAYELDRPSSSNPARKVPSSDYPGGASFTGSQSLGVNAAFLFGLGSSTRAPDWYNGGLENFPRFLEDWRDRTFNYRGSFVSLGEPQHKKNDWACGEGTGCLTGVYWAPERSYDYDADFNHVQLLPPLTPKFVYVQQRLYTQFFN